jgi:hypothetical protein
LSKKNKTSKIDNNFRRNFYRKISTAGVGEGVGVGATIRTGAAGKRGVGGVLTPQPTKKQHTAT